jgi:hypothetical protein
VEWNEGHMRMNVRRGFLLGDSVDAVMSLSRKDLRKLWRFEFIGEMGIDAGGLAREWFQLVTEEMFDPDMGLWQSSSANQMCMEVNPASGMCLKCCLVCLCLLHHVIFVDIYIYIIFILLSTHTCFHSFQFYYYAYMHRILL